MLFLVADHAGFQLAQNVLTVWAASLDTEKNRLQFLTPEFNPIDDYPDVATLLAGNLIATKSLKVKTFDQKTSQSFGLAICGTGQGICMALNRFDSVRAGCLSLVNELNLPENLSLVRTLRQHNDANVLCLPGQADPKIATQLFQTFIATEFSGEIRHNRRVEKLTSLGNLKTKIAIKSAVN